jgi:hypothetical protein
MPQDRAGPLFSDAGETRFDGEASMRSFSVSKDLVPVGPTRITDKASGAIAFIYANGSGQPCAIAFQRDGAKPAWCHSFPSARAREARIRSLFEACGKAAAAKADRKAARLEPHRLQAGHILCAMWGYEQTNVNFYQVTRLIGRNTVELRELGQVSQGGEHWATGKAMPSDEFKGEPFTRRVHGGSQSVRVSSYRTASLWEGKALKWTAYH